MAQFNDDLRDPFQEARIGIRTRGASDNIAEFPLLDTVRHRLPTVGGPAIRHQEYERLPIPLLGRRGAADLTIEAPFQQLQGLPHRSPTTSIEPWLLEDAQFGE